MDLSTSTSVRKEKEIERQKIAQQVRDFLHTGKTIELVPFGQTGDKEALRLKEEIESRKQACESPH
jgi:hypothetical protein